MQNPPKSTGFGRHDVQRIIRRHGLADVPRLIASLTGQTTRLSCRSAEMVWDAQNDQTLAWRSCVCDASSSIKQAMESTQ